MKDQRHKLLWGDRGGLPLDYCFVPTATAWNKLMRVLKSEDVYPHDDPNLAINDAFTIKFFDKENQRTVVVVTINHELDKPEESDEVMGLLVHEAVHVWQHTMEVIGEKKPSFEFEAYGIQRIFANLLHGYNVTRWQYVKENRK